MDAVKNDIEELVTKELRAANENFPLFASEHEGYAVMLEEFEELREAVDCMDNVMSSIWRGIRNNSGISEHKLEFARRQAVHAAVEAVQVAAMAQKFMDSLKT